MSATLRLPGDSHSAACSSGSLRNPCANPNTTSSNSRRTRMSTPATPRKYRSQKSRTLLSPGTSGSHLQHSTQHQSKTRYSLPRPQPSPPPRHSIVSAMDHYTHPSRPTYKQEPSTTQSAQPSTSMRPRILHLTIKFYSLSYTS